MKVFKPMALSLLTRPFEYRQRFQLGIAVVSFVPIGDEPVLLSDISLWKFLPEELPQDQPLDAGIPKLGAEYLIVGRACAPRGSAVPALRVGIRLGKHSKSLHAFGDRFWIGQRPSDPTPFESLPLDWAHAYGGPGNADNPLGKGIERTETAYGRRLPLPNIIDPTAPGNARYRRAAGFGPLDATSPQRASLAGTYDDAWLRKDFPGFARDTDWRFFNIAPSDQQMPNALAGDETYSFENMHPDVAVLSGQLPGIMPRAFLQRQSDDALEEVALSLTTVWFFPHRLRLVMVHHGRAELAEEDGADVRRMIIGADWLGQPRDPAVFHEVMQQRLDPERGAINALRDSDLVPRELLVPDAGMEADSAMLASENLRQKYGRRRMVREIEERRSYVASLGLDPDQHAPRLPPPEEPLPSLEALPHYFEQLMAQAQEEKAAGERFRAESDKQVELLLAGSGMTIDQLRAEREAKPSGPPKFTAAGKRTELDEMARGFRVLGMDPSHIDEILADPEANALWEQAEASARSTYRIIAHKQDPARPKDRDRCHQAREALAGPLHSWARADLTGLDLSELNLASIDLEEAWLDASDLHGSNLSHANLRNAVLAHANLEGCNLDHADLTGANLGQGRLRGASLRHAILVEAILCDADMQGAVLEGANLARADLSATRLEGVDLTGVRAPELILIKAAVPGLRAANASLDRAKFLESDVSNADFSGASLDGAMFYKTNASGIDAKRARLRKAVFAEDCTLSGARFEHADLTGANLRGMPLSRADFADAVLDDADLSGCDLSDATLHHARARRARFIGAVLTNARLTRADCMQASLARADLRGADLTDASLYEADAARVLTDANTRTEHMLTKRMRVRPRART